ncbi:hypothetical protein SEA_ERICMILLARD_133 [Mycobacterium phage EricMillard]|uniref:Uncharacterized protein n=2 Tax=Omegavirus baka TaxID=1034099 RepID=G1D099_9CAUD|nr:hypothetical protein FGG20_gp141 [Mycobacterium phage Baka]AEK08197.1 hypothetical protein PBI_BAKA_141 [Mycobacterium phage Baka]AXQ52365.1 hypothetical protein SEA_ERICMILLARD_133 [Mycobacterium phage EricMillard]
MMIETTLPPLTPQDFETLFNGRTYPFFEDENAGGLYAYGDIDPAEFARLANIYDIVVGGFDPEDACYKAEDVYVQWAVRIDEERFKWVKSDTPNAFPVAVLDR